LPDVSPEQTGRVSTAVNTLSFGLAFLAHAVIGWILDLLPGTASAGGIRTATAKPWR
jgi:hypothetical protein